MKSEISASIKVIAVIAIVFGALSVKSGGSVLFVDGMAQDAGNYVPFVVWFNFFAGFAYIIAGVGIFMLKRWAVWISTFIVISTLITFGLFGLHIINQGTYEVRTVIAMSLRSVVWLFIAVFSYRKFILI